jgi:hypothetical protein
VSRINRNRFVNHQPKAYRPTALTCTFVALEDADSFFGEIEAEAMRQIDALTWDEGSRPDESFIERATRLRQERQAADEVVLRYCFNQRPATRCLTDSRWSFHADPAIPRSSVVHRRSRARRSTRLSPPATELG